MLAAEDESTGLSTDFTDYADVMFEVGSLLAGRFIGGRQTMELVRLARGVLRTGGGLSELGFVGLGDCADLVAERPGVPGFKCCAIVGGSPLKRTVLRRI